MIALLIELEQEVRDCRRGFVGLVFAGFERPERVPCASRSAGLPLSLTVILERTVEISQRERNCSFERVLVDLKSARTSELERDERDRLVVARKAITLFGVDDQTLL